MNTSRLAIIFILHTNTFCFLSLQIFRETRPNTDTKSTSSVLEKGSITDGCFKSKAYSERSTAMLKSDTQRHNVVRFDW